VSKYAINKGGVLIRQLWPDLPL